MIKRAVSIGCVAIACVVSFSAEEARAQTCPVSCLGSSSFEFQAQTSGAGATAGSFAATGAGSFGVFANGIDAGLDAVCTHGPGVRARISAGGTGDGVDATALTGIGVFGQSDGGDGVFGYSKQLNGVEGASAGAFTSGVYGSSTNGGYGVAGRSASTNGTGVYGDLGASGTYAGYFNGLTHVVGNFTASGTKSFKIDHPLDPTGKYLVHAAVESPEVLNVYSGNVMLGAGGVARVILPSYFSALNGGEIRYQLTCVGGFSSVYVSREVDHNTFEIAGGHAGQKVSWQVTGVRRDKYMVAHPMVVEEPKRGADYGTYLAPVEWGQPLEKLAPTALGPRSSR